MSQKSDKPAESPDYRATLFLPATDFPMKAGLPEAEPKWLARWAEMDLYGKYLSVELIQYIRPEAKFPSLEALIAQIAADAARAREILAKTA